MKRNIKLDCLKIFLSVLVVAIHNNVVSEIPVMSHLITNGFCRIAVPCFFVINGFFVKKIISNYFLLKKYILHLISIYVFWMAVYSPLYYKSYYYSDANTIDMKYYDLFLVCIYGYHHLWYISALIYGIMLLFYLKKIKFNDNNIKYLSIIIFFIGCLIEGISIFTPKSLFTYEPIYTQNFLFLAFPFIALGYLIGGKNDDVEINGNINQNIIYVVFLVILLIIDSLFRYYFNAGKSGYLYASLFFLCPLIVTSCLHNKSFFSSSYSGYLGKMATAIYLIHPLIIKTTKFFIVGISQNQRFFLVLFFSAMSGLLLIELNKKMRFLL